MKTYFSKWTLVLKDKEIAKAFRLKTLKKYNKFNLIILSLLSLLSISLFIVLACVHQRYFHCQKSIYDYYVNYAFCSAISVINLIFMAIIVKAPRYSLHRVIIHYVSVCIFILYIILRFILFNTKINDLICFSLTTLEFCYRFLFVVIGLMNFVDFLFTCGIVLVLHTSFFIASFHLIEVNLANSYFYYIFLVITGLLSYFFHRKDIISFCYEFKLNESCEWHKNMLNASNAGVMKIEKDKVIYLNKKAEELILKNKRIDEIVSNSSFCNKEEKIIDLPKLINQNLNLLLNELIESTSQLGVYDEQSKIIIEPLDYLKQRYLKQNKKEFLYLNHQTFYSETNDEMATIEILYCYLIDKDNLDNFEFIFNDVTSTKKKTEFQYKSMFFSKIAHEFKTPLITIGELAEKISDSITITEQRTSVELIKSLSFYMYSLSKDLECFSQIQIDTNDNMVIASVDLNKTVQFVKSISVGLLTRYQKKDKISFNVVINDDVPNCVMTDEVKLRQILINLISNAIKFTNEGSIVLLFELADCNIKITVTDTGIGMDKEIQHKLFTPFEKMIENNPTGVGLGLCIVKELTSKLGTRIEFNSKPNQGSSFYFRIPLITSEDINNSKNNSIQLNVKKDYSSLKAIDNDWNDKTIELPRLSLMVTKCYHQRKINVLIADDEYLIRQASIRVLKQYEENSGRGINIIESEDGFELLYKVTSCSNTLNSVDIIICDENMSYCNGYECFIQLTELVKENKIHSIDFFIISANPNTNYHSNCKVTQYAKPLTEDKVRKMFERILNAK